MDSLIANRAVSIGWILRRDKMNAQDCLQILRDVKDAAFATVDEKGLPHIRIIDVMLVENEKIYFCTARGKDFYAQLMHNNHIAVTALNKDFQMVRLSGAAEKLTEQKKGFEISASCIGCGKCRKICPQQCISAGTPYEINQNHCLHCGLCFENCPVKAITIRSVQK